MYRDSGQGQATPWRQNCDVNRKSLITLPFCCKFKKISLKSDFIHIFLNYFIHVYRPRAGTDNPLGQIFYVNRKALSLCPFVASFKKNSLKSYFIHIFNDSVDVYSPRAGARQLPGDKILRSTERPYYFAHLLQV